MRNDVSGRAKRPSKFKFVLAVAASIAVIATVPASAGPFETANAYYGNKYHVPDFTFTRAEFGNTIWGQYIHLGAEAIVEKIFGATVVYNPATNEVKIYKSVGNYSEAKEPPQRQGEAAYFDCGFPMTFGTIRQIGTGKPFCVPGSSVGTASTVPEAVLVNTIPGTARSCTFDAGKDGKDVHSC